MKKMYLSLLLALSCLTLPSCAKKNPVRADCACEDSCGCKETNPHKSSGCTPVCDPWHRK